MFNLATRVSIRKVAERAGVSCATVSRVLNNVGVPISQDTRDQVHRIAAEMGYQPNPTARALVTGRTQTVVLWTSNLRHPVYGDIIFHSDEQIRSHGFELVVSGVLPVHDWTVDTPRLFSLAADGILAVDLPRGAIAGLNGTLLNGQPIVHMGGNRFEGMDYVQINFRKQAAAAVLHLAELGCKRVAYLVPDWFAWFEETNDDRLGGYNDGMAALGRDPEMIKAENETRPKVPPALGQHIDRYGCPDGLFCYNDDMAIAALRALYEMGLRVPEDVAIVGCNGTQETDYTTPRLSTIVQPIEQMCAIASTFLKQRIADPSLPLQQIALQPHLEIRASSQRLSKT